MNNPRHWPAFRPWTFKIRHHGLQEHPDVLQVQADKHRPSLEHNVDCVEVAVAGNFFKVYRR
jgi:hypothetical protein